MKEGFFINYFKDRGFDVVSHRMERDYDKVILTGTRTLRMMGTREMWDKLPHLIDFRRHGFQTLVKVHSRPPPCAYGVRESAT